MTLTLILIEGGVCQASPWSSYLLALVVNKASVGKALRLGGPPPPQPVPINNLIDTFSWRLEALTILIFKNLFILYVCVFLCKCVCVCVCVPTWSVCVPCVCRACRGQKRASDPLQLDRQEAVRGLMQVIVIKSGSYARASSVLNCWVVFPVQLHDFFCLACCPMWPEGIFMTASVSPWHSPVIIWAVPSFLTISDILILLLAPALGLAVFALLKGNGFRRQDLHLRKSVVALMSLCSCPLDRHTCSHKTHTCVHTSIYPFIIYLSLSVCSATSLSIHLSVFESIYPSNYSSFHPLIYSYIYINSFFHLSSKHPSVHLCLHFHLSIHPFIHISSICPSICLPVNSSILQTVINPSMYVPIHPFVRLSIIFQSMYLYVHPPT